jgi:hypothetical protein
MSRAGERGGVAKNDDKHMDHSEFLECMAWLSAGAVWTKSSEF